MVKLFHRLPAEGLTARILLQVHDEIILEAPEEETERVERCVREVMENVTSDAIPLSVRCESGESWGAFH
jgi:DNA polymerase-1